MEKQVNMERIEKIVAFVTKADNSALRRDFKSGKGFSVNGRTAVKKADGTVAPLVDTMIAEGFPGDEQAQLETRDYRVEYSPANGSYAHSLMFYRKQPPVDAAGIF